VGSAAGLNAQRADLQSQREVAGLNAQRADLQSQREVAGLNAQRSVVVDKKSPIATGLFCVGWFQPVVTLPCRLTYSSG
jgi:hypothetical protein